MLYDHLAFILFLRKIDCGYPASIPWLLMRRKWLRGGTEDLGPRGACHVCGLRLVEGGAGGNRKGVNYIQSKGEQVLLARTREGHLLKRERI